MKNVIQPLEGSRRTNLRRSRRGCGKTLPEQVLGRARLQSCR